jgi:hypothetical protein
VPDIERVSEHAERPSEQVQTRADATSDYGSREGERWSGPFRATPRQDLVTSLLYTWPVVGLYLDGWAHHNRANLETFFTPWHAVFYSGYVVSASWILLIVANNHLSGRSWREAAPQGYGLGVIGLGIFAVGAVGDMIWHTIFGVEGGLDTLFSPTHLVLLTGAMLAALSPFRSAWTAPDNVLRLAPLLSIVFFTAAIAFFFGFASPFNQNWTAFDGAVFTARLEAAGIQDAPLIFTSMENVQLRGITGALFTNIILLGPVLLLVRRWRVPFGSCTLLFGTIAALSAGIVNFASWELVTAAVLAGVTADILIRAGHLSAGHLDQHRLVATIVPVALIGLPFLATGLRYGTGWPPELWTGTIFFGALSGFGMSYLMLPPLRRAA